MARKIETHFIAGPAGRLEALLEEPEHGPPEHAALVCHPHPLYGGTMHNKVVYRLARGLRRAESVVLRFNFRGVGLSEGFHDYGIGEVEDARACLDWLRERYPALPVILAGFSFGSIVILKLGCGLAEVKRLIAVGFPAKYGRLDFLAHCATPKLFIHSTHDEHGSVDQMEEVLVTVSGPKRIHWIAAQDHFFAGALDELEKAVFRAGED